MSNTLINKLYRNLLNGTPNWNIILKSLYLSIESHYDNRQIRELTKIIGQNWAEKCFLFNLSCVLLPKLKNLYYSVLSNNLTEPCPPYKSTYVNGVGWDQSIAHTIIQRALKLITDICV